MLATALLLASLNATPIVSDVSTAWDGKTMTVTVWASSALDAEKVRAELAPKALRITLPGTTMVGEEQSFGDGSKPPRARRTSRGIVVEAPIGNRVACDGEPTVESRRSSLVISASCTLRTAAVAKAKVKAVKEAPEAQEEPAVEETPEIKADSTLKAALALPPAQPEKAEAVKPVAPTMVAPVALPPAPVVSLTPEKPAEPAKAESAKPEPKPALAATAATPAVSLSGPTTSSSSFILPFAVIAALAVGAFFLNRKKNKTSRLVQVVETANLGPKRALIVAKIGGQTLLLGTSEAGITLLSTLPGTNDAVQEPVTATENEQAPSQATFLTRLLGKKNLEAMPSFDQLLAESAEDQELRRKLDAGLSRRAA